MCTMGWCLLAAATLSLVYQAAGTTLFPYFAYGCNMLAKRLQNNNPSAVFYSTAMLAGYRLDFNFYMPSWRGALATIVPDDDNVVWGAMWLLDSDQMAALDEQEGVSRGLYEALNVSVTRPDGGRLPARTHTQTQNPPKLKPGKVLPAERRPSNTYLQVMIYGAIECGLPPFYIDFLYTFPTNDNVATLTVRDDLGYPFSSD